MCLEPCAVLNLCGPWTLVCSMSLFVEEHVGTGGILASEGRLLEEQPWTIANLCLKTSKCFHTANKNVVNLST